MIAPKFKTADIAVLERNAERASALLRIIGSKWRLLVVCQLVTGEKTVTELEHVTGLRQSALSQHLMVLRHRELVITRRVAQNIYYSLNSAIVTDLLLALHKHYCEVTEEAASALGRRSSKKGSTEPKHHVPERPHVAKLVRQAPKVSSAKR
ncbi:MAG: helix-turn-helix transcriptional regulator [Alphaproteobacteria bacterium]|nr:helix-turn-helix domain-containing protein [Alphaproteobacteria bacterium]MDE2111116.1 helix-turn-helix transcriptional regulator [Alphaproteobacteria bacterium]MDE2495934.1 helix-turn-helix transcriptional regulator [Alphaproteobacteria bacterium]